MTRLQIPDLGLLLCILCKIKMFIYIDQIKIKG